MSKIVAFRDRIIDAIKSTLDASGYRARTHR